jgi:hypothetical protein
MSLNSDGTKEKPLKFLPGFLKTLILELVLSYILVILCFKFAPVQFVAMISSFNFMGVLQLVNCLGLGPAISITLRFVLQNHLLNAFQKIISHQFGQIGSILYSIFVFPRIAKGIPLKFSSFASFSRFFHDLFALLLPQIIYGLVRPKKVEHVPKEYSQAIVVYDPVIAEENKKYKDTIDVPEDNNLVIFIFNKVNIYKKESYELRKELRVFIGYIFRDNEVDPAERLSLVVYQKKHN